MAYKILYKSILYSAQLHKLENFHVQIPSPKYDFNLNSSTQKIKNEYEL